MHFCLFNHPFSLKYFAFLNSLRHIDKLKVRLDAQLNELLSRRTNLLSACVWKKVLSNQRQLSILKVKNMHSSGTEAIKTQIQPSKPKREITNITKSQNTKITYGQPSEQLFFKRLSLSNPNRTKSNMSTRKVILHRDSDTKNRQQRERERNATKYRLGTVSN